MKKIKSIFLFALTFLFVLSALAFPSSANALGFTPFGGFVVDVLPCTCSSNFWLYMTPFFSPVLTSGALVYEPASTIVYAQYAIPAIGVWLLGDYIPAVQSCYMYVGISCVLIPSYGIIRQTGTSL